MSGRRIVAALHSLARQSSGDLGGIIGGGGRRITTYNYQSFRASAGSPTVLDTAHNRESPLDATQARRPSSLIILDFDGDEIKSIKFGQTIWEHARMRPKWKTEIHSKVSASPNNPAIHHHSLRDQRASNGLLGASQ